MLQCICGNKDLETGVINGSREIICRSCGNHTENLQDYYGEFKKVKEEPVRNGDKEAGKRLREVMNTRAATPKMLSEKTGIKPSTIAAACCGSGMHDDKVQRICDELGARKEYVDTGTGHKFKQDNNGTFKKKEPESPAEWGKEFEAAAHHEPLPIPEPKTKDPVQAIQAVKEGEIYHLQDGENWCKVSFIVSPEGMRFDKIVWPEGFEANELYRLTVEELAFCGLVAREVRRIEGA